MKNDGIRRVVCARRQLYTYLHIRQLNETYLPLINKHGSRQKSERFVTG